MKMRKLAKEKAAKLAKKKTDMKDAFAKFS